ncbi:MAG: DUF1579 family protein [Isosphaeraceae bacterium]
MGRIGLRLILVGAAMAFPVGAAEAQQPSEAKKDPQSSFEPRNPPGAGQKYLEVFVGDWDVVKTFFPRSGGAPSRSAGTCHQTMIHDGRFLQSDFVFEQGGRKTTGQGIIGFESPSGRFTSVWTDSRQTRMSIRQSKEKFNGKEIILFSRSLEEERNPVPPSRTLSRIEDDGRKIIHRQFTTGADGQERLVMELIMTRKAIAPSRAG